MFEGIVKLFKNLGKTEKDTTNRSKNAAKERLHLVLMQDRANVSADFLDLMKQEIIEVIKKYIDIDEKSMDVRLTNKQNDDGTTGAPSLYANIPIMTIKEEARKQAKVVSNEEANAKVEAQKEKVKEEKSEEIVEAEVEIKEEKQEEKQENIEEIQEDTVEELVQENVTNENA